MHNMGLFGQKVDISTLEKRLKDAEQRIIDLERHIVNIYADQKTIRDKVLRKFQRRSGEIDTSALSPGQKTDLTEDRGL